MKTERPIKPTDAAIRNYYAELAAYGRQGVLHEGAVSSAFENLLREYARRRGWTLIPQLEVPGDRRNVPDGTVRDANAPARGYCGIAPEHPRARSIRQNRNGAPWIEEKRRQFASALGLSESEVGVGRAEKVARDVAFFFAQRWRQQGQTDFVS